jgi:hypothetical protein
MAFWPAWIVAPSLSTLAVGSWIVLRRPLGFSGILARFARLREELERDAWLAALQAERAAILAAKAAAREVVAASAADGARAITGRWATLPPDLVAAATGRTCAPTPPIAVHATFLVSLAAGGLLAAVARGAFGAGAEGPWLAQLGAGPRSFVVLAAGGLLAGFGAALSGGCAAGHGLTGCGRLMPGSLVATPVLLAAAIATSLLLRSLG